jgi:hypothetical protein
MSAFGQAYSSILRLTVCFHSHHLLPINPHNS